MTNTKKDEQSDNDKEEMQEQYFNENEGIAWVFVTTCAALIIASIVYIFGIL